MQPREKILAVAAVALLVLLGLFWGYQGVQAAFDDRYARMIVLDGQLANLDPTIRRGRRADERRAVWRRQSLPSSRDLAQSLYQSWLDGRIHSAGLTGVVVRARPSRVQPDVYEQFTFDVTASGSLEQLTRFLFDFYRADHLHKLVQLTINPTGKNQQLSLAFQVQALALPGADPRDKLSEATSSRLAYEKFDAYKETIVGRNLFAAYTPGSQGDAASQETSSAHVTAIVEDAAGPKVWIHLRNSGKTLRLGVGDPLEVGDMRGVVSEILNDQMILTAQDKRLRIRLGKNLAETEELTD